NFGGFRAQIVTYSLAWLSHHTAQRIDLEKIWEEQQLSKTLEHTIEVVSTHAHQHIVNPPPQRRNPSEWCKREECWEALRRVDIKLPAALEHELISLDRVRKIRADASQTQDVGANEEVEKALVVSADTWFKIARWAKETNNLAGWQRRISFSLGTLATRGKK